MTDLTITIVSWNTREDLRECLRSLEGKTTGISADVHVVDNASDDGSAAMVMAEFPHVRLFRNQENVGFARGTHVSWPHVLGRYWLLLNSDASLVDGGLAELVRFMDEHSQAGLVTGRVVDGAGRPQPSAQPTPSAARILAEGLRVANFLGSRWRARVLLGAYWTYDLPRRIGWAWGTFLAARREAVAGVGLLSGDFFMYGEDLDWSLRMREAGWEVWFTPAVTVVHGGARSARRAWSDDERLRRIWNGYYQAVSRHRHPARVRLLQSAHAIALLVERLSRAVHRRAVDTSLRVGLEVHRDLFRRRSGGDRKATSGRPQAPL